MKINLHRAIENFPTVTFYQPIFEALVNAIEAHATEISIHVDLQEQKLLDDTFEKHITGFRVIDNGEGFTDKNIESFSTYYSDTKKSLGCKGIGRLSWLKVFDAVNIESFTGKHRINIPFSFNFNGEEITKIPSKQPQQTTISFSKRKIGFDKGSKYESLEYVKSLILQELTVKLFLLFREKRELVINLSDDESSCHIVHSDLPELKCEEFSILSSHAENNPISFKIYYGFPMYEKEIHQHWLCADGRKVDKKFKEIIPKALPQKTSSYFLVCSEYLDKQVKQERTEFNSDFLGTQPSLTAPITKDELLKFLKAEVYKILIAQFPNLEEENNTLLGKYSLEYPYLVEYFDSVDSGIINPIQLISNAKKAFDDEKEKVKNNFAKLLKNKKIDDEAFFEQSKKVSEIASRELAEYILYREQIINGISKHKESKKESESASEKFLHNLFMTMGTDSDSSHPVIYDTNLWLLDDKYMGYCHAFSDIRIEKIKTSIIGQMQAEYKATGNNYEPDLAMFYSDYSGQADLVVIEFKKANAPTREKVNALTELSRNIGHIISDFDGIRRVYGYVITQLDEKTASDIQYQSGVHPLFTNDSTPYFYMYNGNIKDKNKQAIDCHMYILSFDSLEADARTRNSTFLQILTGTTKKELE